MKIIIMNVIVAILAASITYFINMNLKKDSVFASGIVALSSGIFLPHFFPVMGGSLAVVATCASYAAMVSQEKFPKIIEMVSVGIICGLVYTLTSDVYVGVGGRLGAIGAISGFTWLGIKKIKKIIIKT